MARFAILLSGPIVPTPGLRAAVAGRRVIAADGGIAHARPLDLSPELWVGDFDSVPSDLDPGMAAVRRRAALRDKDETDGELAIEAALAAGASDILLIGALGGARSDHAFTNLVLALRHAARGLRVELFDGRERAWPLGRTSLRVGCRAGQVFSILRFGAVQGLSVRGARWPLERVDLPFHSILTQSNVALGPIDVELRGGEAILIVQEDGDEHGFA